MRLLNLTLPTPEENLALDEALLLEAEEINKQETLRFWTSSTPFVVVGLGGRTETEVDLATCRERGVPVHRRCSGGGAVVQGPGCLNYSLVLQIPATGPLTTVSGSNKTIMTRHASAVGQVLGAEVRVEGHTDLAIRGMKISGNAQRRMRTALLFHGTFLVDFDLPLIRDLLPLPTQQPAYRHHRSHGEFLKNLNIPEADLRRSIARAWGATAVDSTYPVHRVRELVKTRYTSPEWTYRR